jgi:hypothetical protein
MSVQDETKARRIPGCWRGASEAHIRSDLQRASNEASSPEDKRISLILNANWNQEHEATEPTEGGTAGFLVHPSVMHSKTDLRPKKSVKSP